MDTSTFATRAQGYERRPEATVVHAFGQAGEPATSIACDDGVPERDIEEALGASGRRRTPPEPVVFFAVGLGWPLSARWVAFWSPAEGGRASWQSPNRSRPADRTSSLMSTLLATKTHQRRRCTPMTSSTTSSSFR